MGWYAVYCELCRSNISISHGDLNDVTCHVRVQCISKCCMVQLDLQAQSMLREKQSFHKIVYCTINKVANPC